MSIATGTTALLGAAFGLQGFVSGQSVEIIPGAMVAIIFGTIAQRTHVIARAFSSPGDDTPSDDT